MSQKQMIPVHVQYRHVHLSQADADVLFGAGKLTERFELGHQYQHVCDQTVTVTGENDISLEQVRVFGPTRDVTQIELSPTEAFALGIDAPVRVSGDNLRSGSCKLSGPNGEVNLKSGVIISARHLHLSDRDASTLGLSHHQIVTLAPVGHPEEKIEFVSVRIHPTFTLSFHLTYDEASEFWLETGDEVVIL